MPAPVEDGGHGVASSSPAAHPLRRMGSSASPAAHPPRPQRPIHLRVCLGWDEGGTPRERRDFKDPVLQVIRWEHDVLPGAQCDVERTPHFREIFRGGNTLIDDFLVRWGQLLVQLEPFSETQIGRAKDARRLGPQGRDESDAAFQRRVLKAVVSGYAGDDEDGIKRLVKDKIDNLLLQAFATVHVTLPVKPFGACLGTWVEVDSEVELLGRKTRRWSCWVGTELHGLGDQLFYAGRRGGSVGR